MLEVRIAYSLLLLGLIAVILLLLRVNPFVVENLPGTERRFSWGRSLALVGLLGGYLFAPLPHAVWIVLARPVFVLVGCVGLAAWAIRSAHR